MAPEPAALAGTLLFSGGAVVLILLVARGLVPRLIAATVRVRSRDLFILSVILAVTGIAWVSTVVGISGGLGAFLAGLAISKSAYSHQVLSDILPFRETFNSLFFVSIGMLLDPAFLFARAPEILALGLGVLVLKSGVTSGVVRLLGYPWRIALGVGLLLSQVGEFAIVLLRSGAGDALGVEGGQMVLATILVTMILSPLPVRLLEWFQPAAGRPESGASPGLSDHTLIIGYGLNGRNVASLLAASGFPFAVLEMNPETVGRARKEGTPIFYGDASSESVLEWVGVRDARAVVVAISDPAATRTTVALARQLNPDAFVVARTRYLPEIEPLYEAGASSVITEEFETSLTLIRRLLDRLGVHPSKIDRTVLDIRQRHYRAFRGAPPPVLEVDQAMRMFETTAGEVSAGRTIGDLACARAPERRLWRSSGRAVWCRTRSRTSSSKPATGCT
jgi:CPA2 family monovalent cation:H+ antiporter-2